MNDNNRFIPSYPSGTEVEIFSFAALETAWKNATSEYEKEHVTPYIYTQSRKIQDFNS